MSRDDAGFASWAKGYAICIVFVLFGLLPTLVGSPGTIGEVEQRCERLLKDGKPIQAQVTRKWRGGGKNSYQSVQYAFNLGGRTYDGLADPGLTRWMELSVGSPLEVLYLPSDPSVTEYRPDQWLAREQNSKVIGWGISAAGLIALLVVFILDRARRSPEGDSSSLGAVAKVADDGSNPIAALLAGIVFFVAGLAFQVGMLVSLFRHDKMPVTTTIGGRVTQHFASPTEQVLFTLFPVLFWGAGLALIIYWIRRA